MRGTLRASYCTIYIKKILGGKRWPCPSLTKLNSLNLCCSLEFSRSLDFNVLKEMKCVYVCMQHSSELKNMHKPDIKLWEQLEYR